MKGAPGQRPDDLRGRGKTGGISAAYSAFSIAILAVFGLFGCAPSGAVPGGGGLTRPSKEPVAGPTKAHRDVAAVGPSRIDGAKGTARVGEASRLSGRSAVRPRRRNTYWLVVERGHAGLDLPILGLADGRRVLPVFGFEEEAGLFVRLARRGGRSVRRIGTDELVSLLCGPSGGVELVALDPLSEAEADMLNESVSLTTQGFLDFLLGPGNPPDRRGPGGSARREDPD